MPKLKPPEPIMALSRDEFPKEYLEEADKLKKDIIFYLDRESKGMFILPQIGFFWNGMKWRFYLESSYLINNYEELLNKCEKLIFESKPSNRIEELTNKHILTEIRANRADHLYMNTSSNLGNVQEQSKKYKKPPAFSQKERAEAMKFYKTLVGYIDKIYPEQKVEFEREQYGKIANWQEHELLIMSWNILAQSELRNCETEMKYIKLLLEELKPEPKIVSDDKDNNKEIIKKNWLQGNLIKVKDIDDIKRLYQKTGIFNETELETACKIGKFLIPKHLDEPMDRKKIKKGTGLGKHGLNDHLHYMVWLGILHRIKHGRYILPSDPNEYQKEYGKVKASQPIKIK